MTDKAQTPQPAAEAPAPETPFFASTKKATGHDDNKCAKPGVPSTTSNFREPDWAT